MSRNTGAGNLLIWWEQWSLTRVLQSWRITLVTYCCCHPTQHFLWACQALSLICVSLTCVNVYTITAALNIELCSSFMLQVFGTKPHPWQQEVITHLCCMMILDSGIVAAPVLEASCWSMTCSQFKIRHQKFLERKHSWFWQETTFWQWATRQPLLL